MKKTINYYFYYLDPNFNDFFSDEKVDELKKDLSQSLLEGFQKNPINNEYVLLKDGIAKVLPNTIKKDGDFIYAALSRIQTEGLPPKTDKNTLDPKDLALKDNEGLLYTTPFLYNYKKNILMYPYISNGVPVSSAVKFMQLNFTPPDFKPVKISHPDDLNRFIESDKFNTIEIETIVPEIIKDLDDDSIQDILKASNNFRAKKVYVRLSGSRKEGLNPSEVIKTVKKFFKDGSANKLKVSAVIDEETNQKELFDFVTKNIKGNIEIELGRNAKYSHSELREKLIEKYNELSRFLDII